jgi:hypothetical protein
MLSYPAGMDSLCRRMAERLDVRTSAEVSSVEHEPSSVRVVWQDAVGERREQAAVWRRGSRRPRRGQDRDWATATGAGVDPVGDLTNRGLQRQAAVGAVRLPLERVMQAVWMIVETLVGAAFPAAVALEGRVRRVAQDLDDLPASTVTSRSQQLVQTRQMDW